MTLKHAFLTSLTTTLLLAFSPANAQDAFQAGKHYDVMEVIQPISTGSKVEVLELFWYRCPHCNALEVPLQKWLKNGKPEEAEYVAFPAVISERWEPAARSFYTLEALGLLEQLHGKLFYAIHSERRQVTSAKQLGAWVEEQGESSAQDVVDTYDSFAVNTKVNYATTMTGKYGISSVPAIIVDGKYRTNVSQAGDHDRLFEVINFLVAKAAAERSS
ncbi:MAG: thiol:disulfide interchange protein DsbA [Cryomorphaceae bacterium]|jgi:thiol:disulfide interchange protein DsbA